MKNLINYLKALWRRGLDSQRKEVGVISGEATIEHPFSTYSAPFGTCWQPSGKLHSVVRCAAMLVMLFTIGIGNVWADYTITFKTNGASDGTSAQTTIANLISSGGDYVNSVSAGKAYNAKDGFGVKLGSSSATGYVEMTMKSSGSYIGQIKASKLTVNAAYFDSGKTLKVTVTYTDATTTTQTLSSLTASITGYDVSLTSSKTIQKIKIESVTASKGRMYCGSIVVVAAAAATPTVTPDPTNLSWGTVLQGSSQGNKTISITGTNLTAGTLTISATGGYSVTPTSKSVSGTLSATTLTVTPPSTATTGAKNGKVTISGGGLSSNVEVNLSMTVNAASTVTWMNNGSEYTTTLVENGQKPTFPANPSSCDGTSTTFYGWSTSEWSGKIDDISAKTIYTSAASMPTVSGAVTYYAVFAKAAGGGSTTLLSEDFSSITTGNSTSTSGSGTSWTINSNFSSASYQYQAGGAVKLGSGSYAGYLVTKQLTAAIGDEITIAFKVKGWSSVEGNIQVSGNNSEFTQPSATTYTATMSGSFESKSVTVTLTKANPYIKIATTAKRAFIDDIVITKSGSLTYSQYLTTCCTDPGLAYGTASVTKTFGNGTFKNTLTNSHSVSVTYESSNTDVATVASDGTVTIQGAGNATITARFAGNSTYCADEASYTLTVNKANISPTLTYTPNSVAVGSNTSAPTVGGNPGSGGVTYAITSATPAGCATIDAGTGVVSGVAVGSVTVTATVAATTNYNGGTATANVTITAASGYCISAFNSSNNGITSGFSNGGSGNEYTLSYTIPGKDGSSNWPQYWIGENEAWASFSANALFADMHFTHSDATLGLAEGATGKLHIWDDNKASGSNLWVKFEPDGYGFRWGGAGEWDQAVNTKAFTVDPGNANTYWTEIVTLDGTNNTTWNYYVGLQSASGYVYSGVDNEASDSRGISRTRSVTTMKVSNGTAGSYKATYLNSEATGTRGKFRIWDNNISDHNFVCHFVPYYRVTYNGSGASGSTDPSADVSCEGNDAARTVVAAANGFTVPTGKTFGGWASSPENAAAGVVAYAAGANVVLTSSITLYAIWTDINYTVTVNQNPSVGATTTGQTTTAHYNGTINLTTTVPSGYRFVNWTTSDGFSITNPTSATTASFTMPNKNVTVTANFQQTHTVDWYVGGSAPANKIGDDGQTTVVDHGGKISDFPATTPDGSACEKTFVGWTNTSSYVHGTSLLFTDVAGSPTINADASFYAVFAEVNVATGYTYIGDEGMLEAGETYIFVSSKSTGSAYALKSSDLPQNNTSGVKGTAVSVTVATGIKVSAENSDLEFTCSTHTEDEMDVLVLGSSANTLRINGNGIGYGDARAYYDNTGLYGWNNKGDTYYDVYYNSTSTKFEASSSASGRVYAYKKGGTTYTGHTITCADCGTSVTPTYTAAPTGGTVSVTKSTTPVTSGSTVKTCTAIDLTVTITPAPHYTLTGFTATGLSTGTATISPVVAETLPKTTETTFTVTVSAGATGTLNLTPTFTPETPLSITFIPTVSGATVGSIGTIYSGDNFDFPSVSNLPGGFCADFLGWVDFTGGETFDGDGTRTTAPSELITAGTNSGAITTNKTYKAVYGESETSEAEGYFKVTAAPEAPATWADNHYLIVYEGDATHDAVAFDGSLGTLDATSDGVAVTITSGSIPYSNTLAASEFRIAAITGGYSIQSASGVYIGKEAYSNGLDESTTDAAVNTIAYTSGATVITGVGGCALKYNYASDQLRFRYYKTGQQDIQLYKYGTAPVVTYTYTTAPSCGDKYRVTVTDVTGGSPSASPKYCADGTTISLVANPSTGYSFTSWTITKDGTNPLQDVTSTLLGANSTVASTSFTMPAYDVTVTAAYSITNYNITYNNLNGATNTNPATYNVASADIEFVAPGARAGYIFKGWYDDAVYTNRVLGIPNGSTGAVTVYAKWAVGYTITWDNAIGVNPASTGVEDGNAIGTLPIPTGSCTFDGTTYSNFVGWYTGTISSVGTAASDAGTEITAATVPTASATYHAVYTNMPDYSGTNTSNVTLPANPTSPVATAKIKVSSEDDAPEYDGIKIGTSKNKTGSFTFTVPSGTTKITLHGVAWSGKTASVTLATSVGTISPSTAQSLDDNSGASDNSPFTITSNTTLTFNLANVSSEATITVSNSSERVIVWGINASSASGSDVGYITSCCDNLLAAPTMNSPTVRTSTAITLSWNTVPNATGYKVSWNGGDWEDVGTATTYAKTSLEPGNDYSYKVIAKYTSPYCGASAYEGVVSTKPVYSVTYERGSGTGSCSATGSIPAVAYYEEGATVSLAASNTFSLSGNTFDAWSSEQVALTASSTSFTMPAEDVIITATWMANVDKFYDRMHNLTSGEGSHTDAQGKHYITREGCNYTVPALEDNTDGETACHTSHYVLLGWIAGGHLDSEGKVKSGEESYIFTGGGTKTAGGNTYYAVWAEVTE